MRHQIARNLFNGLPQDDRACDGQTITPIVRGRAGPPGFTPPGQGMCGPVDREAQVIELAPHVGTPWRGKTWSRFIRGVITPNTATGNAAAIAAGAVLAAAQTANNVNATPITALTPAIASDFVTVFQYEVNDYQRVLINKAAFSCPQSAAGEMALRWRVRLSNTVVLEPEEIDFADPDNQMDIFINAAPKQVIIVDAQNGDLLSSYVVEVLLSGWSYPIVRNEDSVPSSILGNGG